MTVRDIYITEYDLTRLQGLVAARIHAKSRDRELLEQLQQELDRAHVVTPQEIPHDIVTMNSRVCITDMESGQEQTYTLVFPAESNMAEGRSRSWRRSEQPCWAVEPATRWIGRCRSVSKRCVFARCCTSRRRPVGTTYSHSSTQARGCAESRR